jgi:hypothetical protein
MYIADSFRGYQSRKSEMDGSCGKQEGFWWGKLEERDKVTELGVDVG